MADGIRTGACLCRAIRYKVAGPIRPIIACHCVQCRKTSGHHVAATSAKRSDIVIEGEVRWFRSSECARRGFCPTCGSHLFWDGTGENLSIHAGTLDGDTGFRIAGHIYCASRGDYYDIPEDLPCADGFDADLTTMVR